MCSMCHVGAGARAQLRVKARVLLPWSRLPGLQARKVLTHFPPSRWPPLPLTHCPAASSAGWGWGEQVGRAAAAPPSARWPGRGPPRLHVPACRAGPVKARLAGSPACNASPTSPAGRPGPISGGHFCPERPFPALAPEPPRILQETRSVALSGPESVRLNVGGVTEPGCPGTSHRCTLTPVGCCADGGRPRGCRGLWGGSVCLVLVPVLS